MTVGPDNTSDEEEKDPCVEEIPAKKSHKEETDPCVEDIPAQKSHEGGEEDFSNDRSNQYCENHTETGRMEKKLIDEIIPQKFLYVTSPDEYKNDKSDGSCKKSKKIEGSGNTSDEDEKDPCVKDIPAKKSHKEETDPCVEDIPAQKSQKDEEDDFSTDGSNRYYEIEFHADTDQMKTQNREMERQNLLYTTNSDEYEKQKSPSSCKKIKPVLIIREYKQDYIEISPQYILYQESLRTNKFEMNVQGSQNIYNFVIQKPINTDISNKNFSRTDDSNIRLTHIKKKFENITQRSEPIVIRHPEKQATLSDEDFKDPCGDLPYEVRKEPGFTKDLKKICSPEKSENPEKKEEESNLAHEDLVCEENLSDSQNEDVCSHSESEGDLPLYQIKNVTEDKPGSMDEIQEVVIEQPDLLNEATTSITDSIHRNTSDKSSPILGSSEAESDLKRGATELSDPNHKKGLDQSNLIHGNIEGISSLSEDQSSLTHESTKDRSDPAKEATEEIPDSNPQNTFDQSSLIRTSTEKQSALVEEIPDSCCEKTDDQSSLFPESDDKCKKQEINKEINETPERYNNKNNSYLKDLIVSDQKIDDIFVKNLVKNLLFYKEINELELRDCVFVEKSLQLLKRDFASECKVTKLTIGYTNNASVLLSDICKVVKEWGITKLSLEYDNLNTEDIGILNACLSEEKVDKLSEIDISYNKDISPDGFKVLGKTMCLRHITTLRAANCDITDTKFESLRVGLADATMVTELDLAGNKTMTAEGFKNLALFITEKDVKCLNLSGCQLTTESVKLFCDTLIKSISGNSSESSLVELDVSYNPVLEPEAYKSLGSMIWKCGVKKISLAGCGLDKYRLSKLTEPLKERPKVESLEVADNVSIGKGIIEIAKIVGECDLEILDISDCMLTADDLKDFREALGEFNKPSLIRLDLSDFDRTPDEEYITELCKIFPYVEDELRAQFRILEIFLQRLMQEKLNSSAKTNLKIILNDDDDDIIWQGNQDKDH